MDGTYECSFPALWTAIKGEFDFVLSQGGEEFVPLRTLVDLTSGTESVVDAYARLGVIVPPILCREEHSFPNAEGAACVCEQLIVHVKVHFSILLHIGQHRPRDCSLSFC